MKQETRVDLLAIKAEICRDILKVNGLLAEYEDCCECHSEIEKLYSLSKSMRVVVKYLDDILYSTMEYNKNVF